MKAPLQHKPKTVVIERPHTMEADLRYSQAITCDNCRHVFLVWILKGIRKADCKAVPCPNCDCETKI
jgi:hypothetical protein